MTLEQILEEVRTLTPEEQRQVRAALDEVSETNEDDVRAREEAWERRMEEKGLLCPREPVTEAELEEMRRFQPVVVSGKPVSETIIEERR